MALQRLFVYGSLKRGGRHHAELRGARFLGEARTVPGYTVEQLGEYPALVATGGSEGTVRGELFEVDDALLALLDEFEGDQYERAPLSVAGQNGQNLVVLAYLRRTR